LARLSRVASLPTAGSLCAAIFHGQQQLQFTVAARSFYAAVRRRTLQVALLNGYIYPVLKDNDMKTEKALPATTTTPARARGVTLIELMIVVIVIAILASVAYPSYTQYVVRANRSAAQQLMIKIASRQEQYILDARSYTDTIGSGGLNVTEEGWNCAATCTNPRYVIDVALTAGPPPGYTITATPQGPQASDGPLPLTLNNLGVKTPPEKWQK
jgi:type IV pilus assembly protein PilE